MAPRRPCRFGVVILGNPRVLSREPLWSALLMHFKDNDCLVEGPLTNLKQSLVQLAKPKRTFDRASFGVGVGATNRYQPPERPGDVGAGRAAAAGADLGGAGRSAAGKAEAAGIPRAASLQSFSIPYGMYDYSIPSTWAGPSASGGSLAAAAADSADAQPSGSGLFSNAASGGMGFGAVGYGSSGVEIGTYNTGGGLGRFDGDSGPAGGGVGANSTWTPLGDNRTGSFPNLAAQIGQSLFPGSSGNLTGNQ